MHPTDGAKLVMKKWIEELQAQPWSRAKKANDQPAFNWALNKTAGQVRTAYFLLTTLQCFLGSRFFLTHGFLLSIVTNVFVFPLGFSIHSI